MRRILITTFALVLVAGTFSPPAASTDEHQVLVRFRSGVPSALAGTTLDGADVRVVGGVWGTDVLVVRGPGASAEALAAELDTSPLVDYAEPDHVLRISLDPPDDPRFDDQYAHDRISSVAGWTSYPGSYTGSGGATVAIIDTGVDTDHPDLAGRIDTADSRCFGILCFLSGYEDDNGHGTHVAGIAAATTNNATGVAGIAYDTRIMALKVCNAIGTCSTSDVASAINWARDRGADVVNMSLGGSGDSTTLRNAVEGAESAGVVLVAAAGNDGDDTVNYPAAYPGVVSVAATDQTDQRASFSNANATVELAAPGVSVLSTYTGGGYTTLSGTSMASPHVAGLAALLVGQNPSWTTDQVRSRMTSCADDLGPAGRDDAFGHGLIDLGRALGTC